MGPDFSGYVTKYGVRCTDGRTILAHAFKGQDGQKIPLVWQHQHNSADNVLGHLVLQHRDDGVWVDGFFNDTPQGENGKKLVAHKDIRSLSIHANRLIEQNKMVSHGNITEGSLVLAGANPGATIENVYIQHGDGSEDQLDGEVIIYSGDELEHASTTVSPPKRTAPKGPMPKASTTEPDGDEGNTGGDTDGDSDTVAEVFNTMTDKQKNVVYALLGEALDHDDTTNNTDSINHDDTKGDTQVPRNVFDQTKTGDNTGPAGSTLSHADVQGIFASAHKSGSLKAAVEEFALSHGIDDIATLFPYDQAVTDTPEFISRRMEWVNGVLTKTRKTPFSRIRSWSADITFQEARAKGYIKGNLKKEEFFRVSKRITTPQTIYKKQRLDRDDILDITEFDVVNWLQTEMRIMLDEELARAILIGDGRDVDDPDKIDTSNVRPIYGDDEMYTTQVQVAESDISNGPNGADAIVDAVVNSMRFYRGSGNPVFYTTRVWLAKMLLIKDTLGRRLYPTMAELTSALGVSDVVPCEALESKPELIGLIVNLQDYTVGADKGGEVSMFDFFDIDYNQFKYLMETRVSGAMTKYRGALALVQWSGANALLPDPAAPTFDEVTGVGTIPSTTGLNYSYVTVAEDGTESAALTAGAQAAIASGSYVTYRAKPASGYEFATDSFEWTFRRD